MAGGRLIPDGAVIVCMDCDWSAADLRARHECPNGRKALQAKLELAEMERDEANGALSETLDMLADAHARMLIPICVHCGTKPGAAAKATHWRECPTHPARAALAAAESALAAAQGALRDLLREDTGGDDPDHWATPTEQRARAVLAAESGKPEPRAAPPALPAELSGKGEQRAYSHEHVFDTQLLCKVCGGCALDLAEEAAEPGEAKKEEGA